MKLAITTYATQSYCYAVAAQAPRVVACLRYAGIDAKDALFVFAGDKSKEVAAAFAHHERRLSKMGAECELLKLDVKCNQNQPHAKASNLVIAQLQEAAFDTARVWGADHLWSLESDILPRPNVLRSLMDTLAFDRGWYDVAASLYCNESVIGGRGTPDRIILPNVYPDERTIPPSLAAMKSEPGLIAGLGWQRWADKAQQRTAIDQLIEQCPPKGNTLQLNAAGWRPRGWFEEAYPGIGQGAIVPLEWSGMGCHLFNERALNLLNFTGYDGGSTQDLWLYRHCIHPHGLRLAGCSHAICDHVKLRKTAAKDGKPAATETVIHHLEHHLGGPRNGHLDRVSRPWNGL